MIKKEIANEKVHDQIYAVMDAYHIELKDLKIDVTAFFVTKVDKFGEPTHEQALKAHGLPAMATCRLANQRELRLGSGRVIIEIDSVLWGDMDTDTKITLFDHELSHIEIKYNKDGEITLTPEDTPALRIRNHDVEVGVFLGVVRRHGAKAVDYKLANQLSNEVEAILQGS